MTLTELARVKLPKQHMTRQYDIVLYQTDNDYVVWMEFGPGDRIQGGYHPTLCKALRDFAGRVHNHAEYYK